MVGIKTDSIRPQRPVPDAAIRAYLDATHSRIIESRSVQHPFLDWYAENNLSSEQERILFLECYYWFKDLPFYVLEVARMTTDVVTVREIVFNVYDEICGDRTHAELYLEFLGHVGLSASDVAAYQPATETRDLNEGMKRLYHPNSGLLTALGALFYDEAMSAIMVSKVNDGLAHNGYDEVARHFWIIHIDVEESHKNGMFNAVANHLTTPENRRDFERGINDLEQLVERFWNMIARRFAVA